MAGSPRVEKAARIRLENPNLSTEEAMKLAGYTDEEAKDQKRQSNVRQKTHRIAKGRKRASDSVDLFHPDSKRMSFPIMQNNNMYQANRRTSAPLHLPGEQNMMYDFSSAAALPMDMQYNQPQQQQNRLSIDSMPYAHNQQLGYSMDNSAPPLGGGQQYGLPQMQQQQQQQQQPQHYQQQHMQQMQQMHLPQHQMQRQQLFQSQPMSPSGAASVLKSAQAASIRASKPETTSAKSPGGSPRIERAARMRLEDPTVSTEEAMKLAGFSDEEARDRKKQNNVRQKTHRLSIKQAPKASQKNATQDMNALLKSEISRLEVKIDTFVESFEARVEVKFQELGSRIDEKFGRVLQLLEMQAGATTTGRKRGLDPQSPPKDPDPNDDILDTIQL